MQHYVLTKQYTIQCVCIASRVSYRHRNLAPRFVVVYATPADARLAGILGSVVYVSHRCKSRARIYYNWGHSRRFSRPAGRCRDVYLWIHAREVVCARARSLTQSAHARRTALHRIVLCCAVLYRAVPCR